MNRFHGHLREMKGWALENWGTIISDPWLRIAGRRERLLGSLEASLSLPVSSLQQYQPHRRADKPRVQSPA